MGLIRYYPDTEWSLPLLFECEPVYAALRQAFKFYNKELTIRANLFGAPASIWSGGRLGLNLDAYNLGIDYINKLFAYVVVNGAVPTLTFSRNNITKEMLKDKFANEVLDLALNCKGRFIVASDILRDYIKSKDANACVVASVIKPAMRFQGSNKIEKPTIEAETNFYNKLLKEYDVVVVRPEYSRDALVKYPDLLDDLSRVEVMINQTCLPNCERMPEHYNITQEGNLDHSLVENFVCLKKDLNVYNRADLCLVHTRKVIDELAKHGIKRFKIKGRGQNEHPMVFLSHICFQILDENGENYCIYERAVRLLHSETQRFLKATRGIIL